MRLQTSDWKYVPVLRGRYRLVQSVQRPPICCGVPMQRIEEQGFYAGRPLSPIRRRWACMVHPDGDL